MIWVNEWYEFQSESLRIVCCSPNGVEICDQRALWILVCSVKWNPTGQSLVWNDIFLVLLPSTAVCSVYINVSPVTATAQKHLTKQMRAKGHLPMGERPSRRGAKPNTIWTIKMKSDRRARGQTYFNLLSAFQTAEAAVTHPVPVDAQAVMLSGAPLSSYQTFSGTARSVTLLVV